MEAIKDFFANGDIWAIIFKVLITALCSAAIGLIGTLIGKLIANCKDSKIRRYAADCVAAAEQKYPNEGKKMGPEKMAYVMDQLAIKFPKIKENTYFYNIAEAAVLELNRKMSRDEAVKEFKEKYGEDPLAIKDKKHKCKCDCICNENEEEIEDNDVNDDDIFTDGSKKDTITDAFEDENIDEKITDNAKKFKLSSF
jgi:hypothetical protein